MARKKFRKFSRKRKRFGGKKIKNRITTTFRKKVKKVVRSSGATNFYDLETVDNAMLAWGTASFNVTSNQSVNAIRDFYNNVINGVNSNNTIGNKCFYYGCLIRGSIHTDAVIANPTDVNSTDLLFREAIIKPKDPYWSLANPENGIANSVPAFQ